MQQSLGHHILSLEQQIQELSDLLTKASTTKRTRDRIEREIQLAQSAMDHYCQGFELEQKLKAHSQK